MALNVVVYGGSGALGRSLVTFFKTKSYVVTSIDLKKNEVANENVVIHNMSSWTEQKLEVSEGINSVLGTEKIDALFCVAGGWAGGNAASKNYIKNCEGMWKQSVWSSTIAGSLAAKHMKTGGLLTLTGASPALQATPGMIGYGMAKAAVHQLCKSFASSSSGLPKDSSTICILPVTLDTAMNRKNMPNADFTSWTPTEHVAELFDMWACGENRPANGSLVRLDTKAGKTTTTTRLP